MSGADLAAWEPPKDSDLWGVGMLRRGVLSVLCGESRTGKSTLALGLVAASWRGDSTFCGAALHPRIRALFVGSEGSRHRWRDDLLACAATVPDGERNAFLESVAVVDEWTPPTVASNASLPALVGAHAADEPAVQGLAAAVLRHRADLVVVDPLYSVALTETEDRLLIAALDGLRRACRAAEGGSPPALLVLAHLPADGMPPEDVRRVLSPHGHPAPMRGNRVLGMRARSVLVLFRHDPAAFDDHSVVLALAKASEAPEGAYKPRRWEMRREPWRDGNGPALGPWKWHPHPTWDRVLWLDGLPDGRRRKGKGET